MKKYGYNISFSAECCTSGIIELTKKEHDILVYACNVDNWKLLQLESYSGSMYIAEEPSYIVEEED